jgi:hypothetical protein
MRNMNAESELKHELNAMYMASPDFFSLVEQKAIVLNGKTAQYAICKIDTQWGKVCWIVFYIEHHEKLYILTGTVPWDSLGKYRKIYFEIAEKFRIIE